MDGRFLLDVVVNESSSVFEALSCEDESLLVSWDTFLVLDLGLHVGNGISCLDFKSNGLARKGSYEDLHALLCCLKFGLLIINLCRTDLFLYEIV